jgi:biotin carboxyl carrier protein
VRRYTVTVDGTPFIIDVEETAADQFSVTVDGATYEAALQWDEDLPGAVISPEIPVPDESRPAPEVPFGTAAPSAPAFVEGAPAAPGAPARPAARGSALPPRVHPPTPGTAEGSRADTISAPMPGVVLQVHVTPGAVLKRGDPVLVLEAMKMRNTIRAPRAAVVLSVEVEAGQPVGPGDDLVRLGAAPG